MVKVVKRENESIDETVKRFSRKVQKEGITKIVREKMYYTKPSKRRREKMSKARRRLQKKQRRY
ncbi:MAG: 30S ribosomal protein S21 [Spirochaetes bacterium]|nr:30S ribosomal protein S21 [Spirochaetota bacterium]